jgi:hypothetical protein
MFKRTLLTILLMVLPFIGWNMIFHPDNWTQLMPFLFPERGTGSQAFVGFVILLVCMVVINWDKLSHPERGE